MLKCQLCDYSTNSQLKLSKHTSFTHKLKFPDYLIKIKYNNITPLCKCGCNQSTKYEAGRADFPNYLRGHQSRQKGHWGDPKDPKRIAAIIKTRKEKFASGEYNHHLIKLKQKRSKKTIEKISQTKKKQWETGEIKNKYKSSKLEKTFTNILELLDIKYEISFYAKDIKAFYDIHIINTNILIEVDGDFWHCNPLKYPNGPIAKCQHKNLKRDKQKNEWASQNGYKLLRFWENDINNNISQVKKILLENLAS